MRNRFTSSSLSLAALGAVALLAGCASEPTIDTSPDAEVTFEGLHEVKGSRADVAWARPGFDLSQYSKIMLVSVGVEYRPGGETSRAYNPRSRDNYFEIPPERKEALQALMRETFVEELAKSEHYTLVSEPGPDVLLIRGALIDVASFVPPEPISRTDIYLSQVGEATLVLELYDSNSEAILARAVDRRAAESSLMGMTKSNRVTNQAEVRRLARTWARLLRERLDEYGAPAD